MKEKELYGGVHKLIFKATQSLSVYNCKEKKNIAKWEWC